MNPEYTLTHPYTGATLHFDSWDEAYQRAAQLANRHVCNVVIAENGHPLDVVDCVTDSVSLDGTYYYEDDEYAD